MKNWKTGKTVTSAATNQNSGFDLPGITKLGHGLTGVRPAIRGDSTREKSKEVIGSGKSIR